MRRLLLALPLALGLASFLTAAPAAADDPKIVLSGPTAVLEAPTASAPPELVRVERFEGPDGVPRYRIWPPEMVPQVAESLGVPLDRIVIEPPRAMQGLSPEKAAREPNSEDTPETVLWNDYCRALDERRIGRGEEIGGLAAVGVRLGGKGQASEMGDVDPAVRASVEAWNERGALVLSVVPGAPAELAGLQAGDVIVQAGPFWIDTPATLIRLASRSEVGREIELLYLRNGQVERTWVTPIDRKELEALQK